MACRFPSHLPARREQHATNSACSLCVHRGQGLHPRCICRCQAFHSDFLFQERHSGLLCMCLVAFNVPFELLLYCEVTVICRSDFTDALFNPTKGSEKTSKTPKEVTKWNNSIIFYNWHINNVFCNGTLERDAPVLFVFTQSSSDYISPYELPLVTKTSTNEAKEIESPAAGNKAGGGDTLQSLFLWGSWIHFQWSCC